MSQSPFEKPNKPFPGQYAASPSHSGSGTGRACGCFAIGCGSLFLLMILGCGGLYYTMMYTSVPLNWIAGSMQESKNVRIEGLKGNLASGFEVDSYQFRENTSDEQWSELKDLKFKYSGMGRVFNQDHIEIDEISVGGGTIYTSLGDGEFELMPLDIGFQIDNEIRDALRDVDISQSRGELTVKRIRAQDLTWIDEDNDLEFQIEEIDYSGLTIRDGEIVDIGELTIKTDNLDLDTFPSEAFDGKNCGRLLKGGIMKPGNSSDILREIPFEFDFHIEKRERSTFVPNGSTIKCCWTTKEKRALGLLSFVISSPRSLSASNQSDHAEPCDDESLCGRQAPQAIEQVESDGSFELGVTRFTDLQMNGKKVQATANVDGNDYR
ncbi:MAG: hypothetical protein R3C03_08345 [Pirellulaceae bacterium]